MNPSASTRLERLASWVSELTEDSIPLRVRSVAASQVLSQLAAVRAGLAHPLGAKIVDAFGSPIQPDPRRAAPVLAALGSWLNLDDTAYAGHLSPSTVSVPMAFARANRVDGPGFLTAVVAANECAARITAAATLGPLRGQSALHTHLAGTVAGRLSIENAPAREWVDAFGLAFATPTWPLMRAFLASEARLLCAMNQVRAAVDACDAAHAGLAGAADLMEHPDGFLARFATVPLPEVIDQRLGERWHTETLSFKMHPGGPGVDAAVDCAMALHPELGATEIAEVTVEASTYTMFADRTAQKYLNGADSPPGALVLSTAYPVATALLTGHFTVADLERPATEDASRWALAERVRLVHDPAMTEELLAAQAPFGEALRQAGDRAKEWLHRLDPALTLPGGATHSDFAEAIKATPARVTVRLANGKTLSHKRSIPIGAAGPDTRDRHAELMREKFISLGGPADVAAAAVKVPDMSASDLDEWLVAALS